MTRQAARYLRQYLPQQRGQQHGRMASFKAGDGICLGNWRGGICTVAEHQRWLPIMATQSKSTQDSNSANSIIKRYRTVQHVTEGKARGQLVSRHTRARSLKAAYLQPVLIRPSSISQRPNSSWSASQPSCSSQPWHSMASPQGYYREVSTSLPCLGMHLHTDGGGL